MKSDRDQSIERLLRGLPRSDDGTLYDGCPDAETLAALADNTLLAAVRHEIETHVADCDRCQMVAAALVRAEGTSAGDAADVRTWKRRAVNWLVPAAAAATAVALWVIVPGQRTSAPEEVVSDQIAIAPSAPAAEATGPRLQTPIDALKDQSAAASPEARADRAVPRETVQPSPNDLSRRQVVGQPALKTEEPLSRDTVSGLPPSRDASAGQSARNDAPRRENDTSVEERATVEAPGRPAAPASAPAGFQGRVAASLEIVSSNAQVRWRIGPGAIVQHSVDGGATWAAQQIVAGAILTAGSSPSDDVCWLVGRSGMVLRTNDAGRQWQRVPFPETVDILVVTASNALNATVSAADGRRFQTTDGGGTWTTVQ
jgi:hypothetical protein